MRSKQVYNIEDVDLFKKQLLLWSQQFEYVVLLDSNNYNKKYSKYDAILAVDAFTSIQTDHYNAFNDFK